MSDSTGINDAVRHALARFAHDVVEEFKTAGTQCQTIDARTEAMAYLDAAHIVLEVLARRYPGVVDTTLVPELQNYRETREFLAAVMGVNPS